MIHRGAPLLKRAWNTKIQGGAGGGNSPEYRNTWRKKLAFLCFSDDLQYFSLKRLILFFYWLLEEVLTILSLCISSHEILIKNSIKLHASNILDVWIGTPSWEDDIDMKSHARSWSEVLAPHNPSWLSHHPLWWLQIFFSLLNLKLHSCRL